MSPWGEKWLERGSPMTYSQRVRLADWAESTAMAAAFCDKTGLRVTRVLCELIRVLRAEGTPTTTKGGT